MTATMDGLLELRRRMVELRAFEDAVQRHFLRGEIHGTVHLYTGQEAVAVGVCAALAPGDLVAATYRGHGAALAMGTEPRRLAAELMGRRDGVCGGRAGSMNVVDLEHGLIGCFGIVGGSIAAATGAALGLAQAGSGVAVAFFGDGAANQGYFHECLNFARVRDLPVIYVCENNLYGEFTPMAAVTAGADIRGRAAGYGIPAERVDGNDVEAVREAAAAAVSAARAGSGPAFLECMTYRQVGHSKTDPAAYRPDGELEQWLERDPLRRSLDRLVELGADREGIDAAEREARAGIDAAVESALDSPYPDVEPAREYA